MGLICFTDGDYNFQTIDEALNIIKSHAQNKDEIWVSGDDKYPCIVVCTNGAFAGITFFENEDGGKELVMECVREFLETGMRPECINWQNL